MIPHGIAQSPAAATWPCATIPFALVEVIGVERTIATGKSCPQSCAGRKPYIPITSPAPCHDPRRTNADISLKTKSP